MNKMTQHEKWMQAMKVYEQLIEFFDKGLSEKECNKLGKALRAVNELRASFGTRVK